MKILQFHSHPHPPENRPERVYRVLLENLDPLYTTALHLCGKADLAEDFVQETARKALQAIPLMRDERNIRAWLFRILINTSRDYIRRSRVWEELDPENEGIESAWDLKDLSLVTAQDVRRALGRLTPALQAVVILIDVEEFTIAEAADMLKIPFGTAASRLARAHQQLRRLLEAYQSKSSQSGGKP